VLGASEIMRASLPEEVGGTNRSYVERVVLAEEFARAWPSLAVTVDSHNIVLELIAREGAQWMKERYVHAGMTGEIIMGDMMSEPEAGSDTRNLRTEAVLDGDEYVITGEKMWTTNGVWANVALLTAVVDRSAFELNPKNGVVHLLLDRQATPWESRDLPFIGLKAGTTSHVRFDSLRVPKDHLFHGADQGYSQNLAVRGWARVLLAAWAIGIMQAALEDAVSFARTRVTFGKPIAEMVQDLDASRLLTYRAAEMMDRGERCDLEQAVAKAFACEAVQRVTAKAIQIHGARGLTTAEGFRTERYYRDARFLTVAEGTTQIMNLIIGRRVLGISAV
jgi:acyl-CoA dehydrogenase